MHTATGVSKSHLSHDVGVGGFQELLYFSGEISAHLLRANAVVEQSFVNTHTHTYTICREVNLLVAHLA